MFSMILALGLSTILTLNLFVDAEPTVTSSNYSEWDVYYDFFEREEVELIGEIIFDEELSFYSFHSTSDEILDGESPYLLSFGNHKTNAYSFKSNFSYIENLSSLTRENLRQIESNTVIGHITLEIDEKGYSESYNMYVRHMDNGQTIVEFVRVYSHEAKHHFSYYTPFAVRIKKVIR